MSEAPERIWLQSAEDAKHQCEGRMWCEDKVWPENADQHEPTEYVRADIAASLQEQVEALTRECERWEQHACTGDDVLARTRAKIEALEAERDRWKGEYLNACRDAASFSDGLVKAEAERDRLAAEVARLREALRMPDAKRRLWHISDLLARHGHFNRRDICEAFDISFPQASLDIKRWLAAHPSAAIYNPRRKRYEIAALASVKE